MSSIFSIFTDTDDFVLPNDNEVISVIVRNSPMAIAVLDSKIRFLMVSNSWLELHNMEGFDIIGKTYYEVFPDTQNMPEVKADHLKTLGGERMSSECDSIEKEDGSIQYIKWENRPWHMPDNKIGGIIMSKQDITDNILFNQKHELERKLLEKAERVSHTGHWYLDLETDEIFWSNEIYKIHGLDPEEYTPEIDSAIDAYHPDDREKVEQAIQGTIENKQPFVFEMRIIRPNHTLRYVRSEGEPELDENGNVKAIFGVFTDITEKHLKDIESKQNRLFLKAVIDSIPDAVYVRDKNNRIAACNSAFLELVGNTETEVIGNNMHINLFEREFSVEELDRRAFEEGYSENEEIVSDYVGNTYEKLIKRQVFKSPQGEEFLLCTLTDITQTKKIQKGLQDIQEITSNEDIDSLERIQKLLEIACYYLRMETALIGELQGADFVVKNFSSNLEDDRTGDRCCVNDIDCCIILLQKEQVFINAKPSEENPDVHPCYEGKTVRSFIGIPLVVNGHIYGSLNISNTESRDPDFSEQEKSFAALLGQVISSEISQSIYIAELKDRERQLEQSNEDLEQFATTASHDLKQPLRTISGFMSLLRDKYSDKLDDEAENYIEKTIESSERMEALIEGILEYARLENASDTPETIDSTILIEQAIQGLIFDIDDLGVEIKYGESCDIACFPEMMHRLIFNLIQNAIKYNESDPPIIEINCVEEDNFFKLSFKDNGIGMKKGHLDKIFLMFHRLHNDQNYAGTGVGLSICKRIVEFHKGRIEVQSEFGKGTQFNVYISRSLLS